MANPIHCARERTDTICVTRFDQSIVLTIDTSTGGGDIVLTPDTAATLRNQLDHFLRGQDDRRRVGTTLHAWRL
jgi:hypothetical protein